MPCGGDCAGGGGGRRVRHCREVTHLTRTLATGTTTQRLAKSGTPSAASD